MTERFDAIIIGGGHNGLACAAYLARGGLLVLVLEAAAQLGGAAVTREFAPGFRVSACAQLLHMLPRRIVAELDLVRHGLALAAEAMPTTALSESGSPVGFSAAGVSGVPADDAAAYAALMARLRRMAAHLRPLMDAPPPRLGTRGWADNAGLLRLAWQIRSLGRADMRELLRIIGMNVYDLAEDHFDSAVLRGALAFDAVLGSNAGPRGPGTVLTLLYRLAAEQGAVAMAQPVGGMGAVSGAFAAAAAASGAVLRTSARVARVLVENDRAVGVVLEDGSTIAAPLVISSADPRTTFLGLLGAAHLDTGFVRRVTHFRDRGLTGKLHLALSGKPVFRGVDEGELRGRLLLAGSLDDLENAFNPTKYGQAPDAPPMEIVIPTIADPSLAPAGQHVLSANVHYVPYALRAGWGGARDGFLDRLIRRLDGYAPGLRQSVIAAELLTPADIEREFNIAGGHWHHGELAFDQFFMVRPVPGATQYQTPLPGLYLCGAGAHPGGGVMGVAGRNAARCVLAAARTKQAA
jgi:phytoene dehydrogenase-like protein